MNQCDIKSCKASFVIGSEVTFHKLPCNHALREAWLDSIGQENLITRTRKTVMVCSQHFEPTCFYYTEISNRRMLQRNSIPSVFATAEKKSNSEKSLKTVEAESESESYMSLDTVTGRTENTNFSKSIVGVTNDDTLVPQVKRDCSSTLIERHKKKKQYHMVNPRHVGHCQTNFKSITEAQKSWIVAMQEIKRQRAKMHVWKKKNVCLQGYVKTLKHLIGQVRQHIRNMPDSLIDDNK